MKDLKINAIYEKISETISSSKSPLFISDWNMLDYERTNLKDIIEISAQRSQKGYYHYLAADEEYAEQKELILKDRFEAIKIQNIAISSNGTTAIFVLLMILSQQYDNFLLFSPTYFLYSDLLTYFNKNVYYYDCMEHTNPDLETLEHIIRTQRIQVLIVIDPVFSMGISLPAEFLEKLSQLSLKYGFRLWIDGVFSDLEWNEPIEDLLPVKKIKLLEHNRNYIFLDSLSKKLGINGNKFSIVFADQELIKKFQEYQLYVMGSYSISQLSFLEECYEPANMPFIKNELNALKLQALETYKLLHSVTLGTKLRLNYANAGYFACLGIDKNFLGIKDDIDIFNLFIQKCNIATLPMSIYQTNTKENYVFRINLLLEKGKLIKGIKSLQDFIEKRSA